MFKTYLFIQKSVFLGEEAREKRKDYLLFVYFPNGQNSQDRARPKPGSRASFRLSMQVQGPKHLAQSCAASPGTVAGCWTGSTVARTQT